MPRASRTSRPGSGTCGVTRVCDGSLRLLGCRPVRRHTKVSLERDQLGTHVLQVCGIGCSAASEEVHGRLRLTYAERRIDSLLPGALQRLLGALRPLKESLSPLLVRLRTTTVYVAAEQDPPQYPPARKRLARSYAVGTTNSFQTPAVCGAGGTVASSVHEENPWTPAVSRATPAAGGQPLGSPR